MEPTSPPTAMINFRRNKFSAGKAKYPNIYYMTSVS
jgi:hypothetical protein